MKIRFLVLIISVTIFSQCSNPAKEMQGFNSEVWIKDKKGCNGARAIEVENILKNRDSWKGMDDDVLLNLLGKPEKSFYYERQKKAYAYFIESGSQCDPNQQKEGKKLVIEFHSLGYVNLMTIQK